VKYNGDIGDKAYWEKFYSQRREPFVPSLFARYVLSRYLTGCDSLIELGCGNGRDAVYFAKQGINVLAVDQCSNEIQFLSRAYSIEKLKFLCGDFTYLDENFRCSHVYSRFTMHSISTAGETAVLGWIHRALKVGGYFLLEARGKNNELYGKGEPVPGEADAFIYDGHYRRFLDFKKICTKLEEAGMEVVESAEDRGFAPFNELDERFMRVIAKKVAN
jgi:tellurite methyltransferase